MPIPRFRRVLVAALLASVPSLGTTPGSAAATAPAQEQEEPEPAAEERILAAGPERQVGLAAALRIALDRNPLTRATRLDEEKARLDVELFDDFWSLPQIGLDGNAGVVPAARGDIFRSIDTADDLNNLGPFFKFQLGVVVPVYTFGRTEHALGAARGRAEAEESRGQRSRDELSLEVIRAYWGLRAAQQMLDVFGEMRDRYYEDLLPEVEEKLEDVDIDPNDAYEIRSARYDIDKTWLDAAEQYRVVHRALTELLGEEPETRFVLDELTPPSIGLERADLGRLRAVAGERNPQVRALRAGVAALEQAMRLELAERWPAILLGGGFGLARAPGRDDQDNPVVWDDFNYRRMGAAFNVRWDLNFARHRIDYLKRSFERDATEARAEALEMRLGVEVHQALEKVLKYRELLVSVEGSRDWSRRWLRTAFDDFDLGLGEAGPLIKAYRADYRLQGLVVETQYLLNVSLAELCFAMGDFHTYLQWIEDGQVALD